MFITSGVLLPEVDGEIKLTSVSQSATKDDNEAKYGADKAIDRDLSTDAYAVPGESRRAWFKVSLDKEYCIEQIVRYWG